MTNEGRMSLAAAFGALLLKLVTTRGFAAYVRPRMAPFLLAGGVTLLAGAVGSGWSSRRPSRSDAEAQAHARGARLSFLLLGPIVLLAVMPPLPLGAAAAAMRRTGYRGPSVASFPSLPSPRRGAVDLTVSDFVGRALFDPDSSLRGVRLRLIGLVVAEPHGPPGGFELLRYAMFCCAADAIPLGVRIRGWTSGRVPAQDTWVEVIGTWRPAGPLASGRFDPSMMPTLDADAVVAVPEPADPYDPPF